MTSKRIFRSIRLTFVAFTLTMAGFALAEGAADGTANRTLACGSSENPCLLPALVVSGSQGVQAQLAATPVTAPSATVAPATQS